VPTDHPRNSEAAEQALRDDGVDLRLGVRAVRAEAGTGRDGADVVTLGDGTTAEGHATLLAVGRTFPVQDLGLDTLGIDVNDRDALPHDGRLRIADGLYLIGDVAGPELHTHQAHYQGELTARINDDGWDSSYAEWLKGSRLSGQDAVLVFSVGGGSPEKKISVNLVRALEHAASVKAAVFGVVGKDGGYTRKVAEARKATDTYGIEGTPSIVVNGRYLTSSGMTDDVKLVVPVAQALIEMVRARK
jgi:uncharacterized metal-binding protein